METSDSISLVLRLALLESLTLGDSHQISGEGVSAIATPPLLPRTSPTLLLQAQSAQSTFLQSIEKYRPIVQFVNEYKDNKAYLQPSGLFGAEKERQKDGSVEESGPGMETNSSLSTQSIIALLLESEPELKQLNRDLRACDEHHERNTAGAGKLADHVALLPRLAELKGQYDAACKRDLQSDNRVLQLLESYNTQIDTMSKLFICWDQVLTQTENALTQMERPSW